MRKSWGCFLVFVSNAFLFCKRKTCQKAQYRTGIYVDRRSIEEAEESKLSDLESCPLKCIRRVNPKLPRRPKQPPKHAPSWIEDKPISTWSELHRFVNKLIYHKQLIYFTKSKNRIDGCSAGSSFNRNAQFSTPIQHQLNTNTDIPHQLKI